MLLDRIESAAFEVAVFGRVSSGKSSLLNYVLQTDVLPIGVTPVTAIPTRISHGPVAQAGIEFAEAQPQIISLPELPEFATEQKNPGNKKHVTRIFVKLPSDRLAEGVTFVDTPGLGSLAIAGAEETIAYLPRCDLGIVLIDASAGLCAHFEAPPAIAGATDPSAIQNDLRLLRQWERSEMVVAVSN
jgi:hypothetical protein